MSIQGSDKAMAISHNLPHYPEIKQDIETIRQDLESELSDSEDRVRSIDEALILLELLSDIQPKLAKCFQTLPSLESLFSKEFSSFRDFINKDEFLNVLFFEDYLFSENKSFPLYTDGIFDEKLIASYKAVFSEWIENSSNNHVVTLDWIKNDLDLTRSYKSLECQCTLCISEYRAKYRNSLFQASQDVLNETILLVQESIQRKDSDSITEAVDYLNKKIDSLIKDARNKLRKTSINKLERQLRNEIKRSLTYNSEIGKSYVENILKDVCIKSIEDSDLKRDLVDDEELDKFFSQLGVSLWRPERIVLREFRKLTRSLVLLKRKDISSQILQEYLSEFWVHSIGRTLKRKIIYHKGPTNSGKTYHAIQELAKAEKGCYLAPLRLLAGELFDTMNAMGVKTSLLTGEEVIDVFGATHYSSTIEMAKLQQEFDCVVIDEIQMIKDPQRGWAWTRALVNIFSPVIHICGDESVLDLIESIVELTGDELEVRSYERMTELKILENTLTLGELERGDAVIVFSRRNALKYKADLENLGFKVSIVYGRLSPEVRREQARKFDMGETDIIVSTDAIAMGMNLPIKRIIFTTLTKFIDDREIIITDSEIKQIAGRAGRFQRHPIGYTTTLTRVDGGIKKLKGAFSSEIIQEKHAMVGPDLDLFRSVNNALEEEKLKNLSLAEFLRLFNTVIFKKPFYGVNLTEMIELAEMVEESDVGNTLSSAEKFGFACAPVNMGLVDHVQYYVHILNNFVKAIPIRNELINHSSDNIDYLETSIKCVELYQWLSRHFNNKGFVFDDVKLHENKADAINQLNELLSQKIIRYCSSCGCKLPETSEYGICEDCFKKRRFKRGRPKRDFKKNRSKNSDFKKQRGDRSGPSKKRRFKHSKKRVRKKRVR